MADDDFQVSDSGASQTFPMQCSALRKSGHVMIKSRPCKIVEMSTSKTGKHGHAKVHLVGIDLFTSKKYEDICPSTHNMNVPNVSRIEYTVTDVTDDDFVDMIDDSFAQRSDLKLPEGDVGKELKAKFNDGESLKCTVLKAVGLECIIAVKTDNN